MGAGARAKTIKAAKPLKAEKAPTPRVRDRIFTTACGMFHRGGIRDVCVDAIANEAGSNKMSFYRNFSSKDELVAEFLRDQERDYWPGGMPRSRRTPATHAANSMPWSMRMWKRAAAPRFPAVRSATPPSNCATKAIRASPSCAATRRRCANAYAAWPVRRARATGRIGRRVAAHHGRRLSHSNDLQRQRRTFRGGCRRGETGVGFAHHALDTSPARKGLPPGRATRRPRARAVRRRSARARIRLQRAA